MKKADWKAKFNAKTKPQPSPAKQGKLGWLAEIGLALSNERKHRKLSQGQIANALDINRSIISKIENGNHDGSLKPVIKYLNYFKFKLIAQPISTGLPQLGDNSLFEEEDSD